MRMRFERQTVVGLGVARCIIQSVRYCDAVYVRVLV